MSKSDSSQSSLVNLSSKFGGKTPVRVYFLDNSSKMFLLEAATTVADFILMILEKFDVLEKEDAVPYFGLFESLTGGAIDGVRNMEEKVCAIVEDWNAKGLTNAKFVFMIRLFMKSIWGLEYEDVVSKRIPGSTVTVEAYLAAAKLYDEHLLHLQYLQAVYHVITGQYVVTPDQALKLGSLHFTYKFGQYNPEIHKMGYIGPRIVEFIPTKLLKTKKAEQWEKELLELVADMATSTDDVQLASPERRYMDIIFPMVMYGCTFYRCKYATTAPNAVQSFPPDIILGVYDLGIHLFDKSRTLLRTFRLEEIIRWGFRPNELFYFEVKPAETSGEAGGVLEFGTTEGKRISDLLTDYALGFMKEKERVDRRNGAGRDSLTKERPLSEGKEKGEKGSSKKASKRSSQAEGSVPAATKGRNKSIGGPDGGSALAEKKRQTKAAVRIQALFRGYQLRRDWCYEDAAILIQTIFRGYSARVKVSEMIEALLAAQDEGVE